jgi:hypothetical protein
MTKRPEPSIDYTPEVGRRCLSAPGYERSLAHAARWGQRCLCPIYANMVESIVQPIQ